jgi:hypothetical protein
LTGKYSKNALNQLQNALNKLVIYPNPVSAELVIDFGTIGDYSITIQDFIGKRIMNHKLTGSKAELDLRQYPAGNYTAIICNNKGEKICKKIIKT